MEKSLINAINGDNNYSDIIELTQDEVNEIQVDEYNCEKKNHCEEESKWSKLLKCLSVGKYTTPLYYKSNDSYSSKIGGIITLICGILFFAYAILLLI